MSHPEKTLGFEAEAPPNPTGHVLRWWAIIPKVMAAVQVGEIRRRLKPQIRHRPRHPQLQLHHKRKDSWPKWPKRMSWIPTCWIDGGISIVGKRCQLFCLWPWTLMATSWRARSWSASWRGTGAMLNCKSTLPLTFWELCSMTSKLTQSFIELPPRWLSLQKKPKMIWTKGPLDLNGSHPERNEQDEVSKSESQF